MVRRRSPNDTSVVGIDNPAPLPGGLAVHIQLALLEPGLNILQLHFKDRKRLALGQQALRLVNILLSSRDRLRRLLGIRKLEAQPESQHENPICALASLMTMKNRVLVSEGTCVHRVSSHW